MENEDKMTLHELVSEYMDKYTIDKISKEEFEEAIRKYEDDNDCIAPNYVYNRLNIIEKNKQDNKFVKRGMTIICIIIILIIIGIIRIGVSIFSNHDYDNDGLTNSFEEEHGTDPNEYTWNDELD